MRHAIRILALALAAVALALVLASPATLSAQSQQQTPQPPLSATPPQNVVGLALLPPPDPAAVNRGKQIFSTNCAFCHGANATGGEGGPDLIRSVVVLHDEGTGSSIGPVILNGRPGTAMPKFNFTSDQIKDIAAFLLAQNQAAANRRAYQVLDLATGDAVAGKQYFDAHCASCHSVTGDLAHVAGKFAAPNLQQQILYPIRVPLGSAQDGDSRIQKTVTVSLSSGRRYSGKLIQLDDFSVSLLDESGQYHSWELDGRQSDIRVEMHDPLEGHLKLLREYRDADIHNLLTYLESLK